MPSPKCTPGRNTSWPRLTAPLTSRTRSSPPWRPCSRSLPADRSPTSAGERSSGAQVIRLDAYAAQVGGELVVAVERVDHLGPRLLHVLQQLVEVGVIGKADHFVHAVPVLGTRIDRPAAQHHRTAAPQRRRYRPLEVRWANHHLALEVLYASQVQLLELAQIHALPLIELGHLVDA